MTIFKETQKFFILRNQIRDADKNYVHTRMFPVTLQRTKKTCRTIYIYRGKNKLWPIHTLKYI